MNHFRLTNESRERVFRRFFEIVPGAISWLILLFVTVFAVVDPIKATVFVICFYLFWLFRLIYMTIFLVVSFAVMHRDSRVQWLQRCEDLTSLEDSKKRAEARISELEAHLSNAVNREEKKAFKRMLRSEKDYLWRVIRLKRSGITDLDYRSVYHVVIFPNFGEPMNVLEAALDALKGTDYPLERIIVVMAFEEREGEKAREKMKQLKRADRGAFFELLCTFHPADLPGERAVKGANATWAAKQAAAFLEKKKIPFDSVLVSCFDADTCVRPEYFSCLTYNFLIRPDRLHCSFQPIPMYHNNLWEAPTFARMMETTSSFWQMIESANPDHLVTFSSHSMSFKTLVEADYWPVDMISDDSAIFWRCFLHYDGVYRAIPLPVTLSMSIVAGDGWWDTFRKIYVQKRRWAWGIENFPMIMLGFLKNKKISFFEKMSHSFTMLESHISWATWGLMITFFGWLPIILGGREYGLSVVSYNLPRITQVIFNLAGISIMVSTALSFLITPKRPPHVPWWKNFSIVLHWFLLPLILPALLALPALDAQTRLLLGKYLNFEVTKKTSDTDRPAHPKRSEGAAFADVSQNLS